MLEYTTFKKSELLVSYSNFPFKKINFLVKSIVLAAIQSPKFPFIYNIAADAAYARKIATHLCRRQQRQYPPRQWVDQLDGRAVAQHTPVVA